MYKVVEIFKSIDGEGRRTGMTANFIRLAGCNLRCTYCDTAYALFGEEEPCEYEELTAEQILSRLEPRYKRVTLTGGEPLIHEGAAELIDVLSAAGYEVNIETNGAVDIRPFIKERTAGDVFFTIDYKLPSSGMEAQMLRDNFHVLRKRDVIKFVVGSRGDINVMRHIMRELCGAYGADMPHVYAGAVYGAVDYAELVEEILSEPLFANVCFQIQLHKVIWQPDKRGV